MHPVKEVVLFVNNLLVRSGWKKIENIVLVSEWPPTGDEWVMLNFQRHHPEEKSMSYHSGVHSCGVEFTAVL
jgi:hypothetical protein